MAHTADQVHGLLLAQLESLAAQKLKGDEARRFTVFLRHYLETAPADILNGKHPPELYEIVHGHWSFAQRRKAGELLVRVFEPDVERNGWHSECTVLETALPDLAFLVDSLSMAVRNAGCSIHWLVHPVLEVKRGTKGEIVDVSNPSDLGDPANLESFVHLQFDRLEDEEARQALAAQVREVVADLQVVVEDYQAMRALLAENVARLDTFPEDMDPDEIGEIQEFLRWLDDDHFTFLGAAVSEVVSTREGDRLAQKAGSGLGILRGQDGCADFIAPAEELGKYARSRRPMIVTKTSERSRLHHPEYLDAIAIRSFDANGDVSGVYRFIGLFTSEVYNTLPRRIPAIRRKIARVREMSRLREGGHAGKQLQEILNNLPRDELFQSTEDELYEAAMGIRALRESQQLRLFMRRDRYGRFFSCMVYLNRDRYSPEIRARMADTLMGLLSGDEVEHHVQFQRDGLARINFIIRTPPGTVSKHEVSEIESRLRAATRSWQDELQDYLRQVLPDATAVAIMRRFHGGFPPAYRETVEPVEAATDVQYLNRLTDDEPVLVRLSESPDGMCDLQLKVYARGQRIALSDVLPTLENFGLRVISQHPHKLQLGSGDRVFVQDFALTRRGVCTLATERLRTLFEDAFLRTWSGEVENDGINGLILAAGLDWRQATLARAICKYLRQTGLPYSQEYIQSILLEHSELTAQLVRLFELRFEPQMAEAKRKKATLDLLQRLDQALDAVVSLDADRVLRGFLSVVTAALRTNYYQRDDDGHPRAYISFKLNPAKISELPEPRPMFEAFVYSPDVEGIHLRGGKVARGGLRWSDRREDFRTEVLGLVKAQMVKNAVIVPVGAKGGFVVKRPPAGADRDAYISHGIECYKDFIRGLLDITDNYREGVVVPPEDVVRYDDDDPYLVVAADKGTATFSDIANSVSADYGFWLGDAFASGGSAGYDHKKMGITARGAWESVKRHFRECGVDCQNQDFTCVGIGDMAGDVFGNGMLLSGHTRLVAAFNHLHIFIDPNPDPKTSYAERKRLFELPRSAWTDYNTKLISEGGGVFERSAKLVRLSPQAREALGIAQEALPPTELIREILKAPVDLLWNGGIGTYVKARSESHQDVGDRANDGLRVNGADLRCRIVGEGGNLGLTQRGRIEFALNGGRVITDANDNAGGVNSSDREVNIKIPLNERLTQGTLELKARNKLLEGMTDDVASAVLRDNYLQTLAISLHHRDAEARINEHASFMRSLERAGLLNRAIEYLPDEDQIKDRVTAQQGLTPPELSVLVSYSKIQLYQETLASDVPDDPSLTEELLGYFPAAIRKGHREDLEHHRLRREIIATTVTNEVVNRMGITYAQRLSEEHGATVAASVKVYLMAARIFGARRLFEAVEAVDGRLPTELQYQLLVRTVAMLKQASVWLVKRGYHQRPIGEVAELFAGPIGELSESMTRLLPPAYGELLEERLEPLRAQGVPEELAIGYATQALLASGLDIAELATDTGLDLAAVATVYFAIGARLSVPWLHQEVAALSVEGRWHALARGNLRDELLALQRQLTGNALKGPKKSDAAARFDAWSARCAGALQFAERRLAELQATGSVDFLGLSVAVRELGRVATAV